MDISLCQAASSHRPPITYTDSEALIRKVMSALVVVLHDDTPNDLLLCIILRSLLQGHTPIRLQRDS